MSEASDNAIADALDASVVKTTEAQSYTLRDGTSVTRPTLSAQMEARQQIEAAKAVTARKGLYKAVGFAR